MPTLQNSVSSVDLTTALGGAAPAAADTVMINRGADRYTTNMAFANDITRFETTPGFSGSFGEDGSRLELLSTAGVIIFGDAGRLANFRNRGTNARVEIRKSRGGVVNIHDNIITLLLIDAGFGDVFDTCDADTVRVGETGRGLLRKHATTTTATAVVRGRGVLAAERPVTAVSIFDGAQFIARETCAPTVTGEGGSYIHEGGSSPTLGNCANITLDFSRVRVAMTLGGTPTFYSGVKIILPPGDLITLPSITNVGRRHEIIVAG